MSIKWAMPRSPVPNRLVTQTLPRLSMARPLLLIPVLKFSALLGSDGGEACHVVHSAIGHPDPVLLVDAEMKWRLNDLHGSALSPSQTMRPLLRSPLGKWTS